MCIITLFKNFLEGPQLTANSATEMQRIFYLAFKEVHLNKLVLSREAEIERNRMVPLSLKSKQNQSRDLTRTSD